MPLDTTTEQEITGEIIRQRRFDSGYTVLTVVPEKGKEVTLIGEMPQFADGMCVRAVTTPVTHPKYGLQYRVHEIEETGFDTETTLISYLAGKEFPGIGVAFASKIVNKFGLDTLSVIDNDPEQLYEVGIPKSKVTDLIACWKDARGHHQRMTKLMALGLTMGQAVKAEKRFGEQVLERIEENYYCLIEIYGISFKIADRIALKNKVARDSVERAQAAITFVLQEELRDGHCFVLINEAVDKVNGEDILDNDMPVIRIGDAIKRLIGSNSLVQEDNRLYLANIHAYERTVCTQLLEMLRYPGRQIYKSVEELQNAMQTFNIAQDITLAPEQLDALFCAINSRVVIITGGPGTGKTTITRALCDLMDHNRIRYDLCSPTGRAAKRLQEATGRPASTIHRLLKSKGENAFEYGLGNPLDTDGVIVDEFSMVDLPLSRHLLAALETNDRLVMVGDADQLPSVGPGNLLRDLIASKKIPTVRLQRIFRQDAGSSIILTAHDVLHGKMPDLPSPKESKGRNCMLVTAEDPQVVIEYILALITKHLPKLEFTPTDIQVLTPMRQRGLGIQDLNPRLQEALNPPRYGKNEAKAGATIFREGDRVLHTRNDYDKGVFNGDVGIISQITRENDSPTIYVNYPDIGIITYDSSDWDDLLHAFASTIHRAQGSEYKVVILVCHTSQYHMLARNLFYTGLTRAKKLCIIIGTRAAVLRSVENNREVMRNTTVAQLLANGVQK